MCKELEDRASDAEDSAGSPCSECENYQDDLTEIKCGINDAIHELKCKNKNKVLQALKILEDLA